MNDIEKLNQVINTLEKQSSRVTDFNGVLSAVKLAKEQIEAAKTQLVKNADEQKSFVSVTYRRLDDYGAKLTKLETLIASSVELHNKVLKQIAALEFVTPEHYEQSRVATVKAIEEQFAALSEKVDVSTTSQQSALKSLRTMILIGVIILAGGIAYLAKITLM